MFRFFDRHLAMTGTVLMGVALVALFAVPGLVPEAPNVALFGPDSFATAFILGVSFLGTLGGILFLLGVSRSHLDRV